MQLSNGIRSVENESRYNENDDKVLWLMPIRFWELENKPLLVEVVEVVSNGVYGIVEEEYGKDRVFLSNDTLWKNKDKCRQAQYGMAQIFEARQSDHTERSVDLHLKRMGIK